MFVLSKRCLIWSGIISLILWFLILFGIHSAFANTYYVSPTGSNTSPYDTWAKAANLPSTAITAGEVIPGPHTLYIAPGTYNSIISISGEDGWISGIIQGTSAHGSTALAAKGQVLLNGAGNKILINRAGVTIEGISFTGGDSGSNLVENYKTGTIFDSCYLYDPVGRMVMNTSGGEITFIRTDLLGGGRYTGGSPIRNNDSGSPKMFFVNSIIDQSINYPSAADSRYPIQNSSSNNIEFRHSILDGGTYCNGLNSGTGKIIFYNSFVGCPSKINDFYSLDRTDGEISAYNSILIQPFATLDRLCYGGLTNDVNNLKTDQPFFTKRKRSGIIVLCIDDSSNLTYAQSVETVFSNNGIKGNYFIESDDIQTYLTDLQGIHNRGVLELACHSYSHAKLSLTGNIYSITKAGATINVDRTNNQIVVTPGGTVSSFKTKTLLAIKTELEGFGCTVGSLTTGLYNDTLGEIMAGSSGAQASPYIPQLLIDTTCASGLFKSEIADAKALFEAAFGTEYCFATPEGVTSADVETAVKNAGFWGCRNEQSQSDAERLLSAIDLYQLSFWSIAEYITFSSATDAQVKERTIAICENAAKTGSIIFLLAHSTAQCTVAQWEIIIDTIQGYTSDIQIMSMYDALNYIKTHGEWSTADQRTYTRTWTDTSDYHLTSGSPCIDAGIEASVTSDYYGNLRPQGYAPDIGINEVAGGQNYYNYY
jgi:hypothetical protein